jgi:flagellar protein FlgJ
MSIFPTTDLISDVANSADSRRLAAGLQRLRNLSMSAADKASNSAPLSVAPQGGKEEVSPGNRFETVVGLKKPPPHNIASIPREVKSGHAMAARKFEAFILQTWLETLLPKTEGGSFGTDGSANIWRSMMAEQLGMQLARSDVIGLQKIITTRQDGDIANISVATSPSAAIDLNQNIRAGENESEETL